MRASVLLLFLGMAVGLGRAVAEETPHWDFEWEPSESAALANVKWHKKDYGWLLTCLFSTPSSYSIRPVAYLHFEAIRFEEPVEEIEVEEGIEVEPVEVVVWEDSKLIRREDLDKALNGRATLFVRMLFKDLPDDFSLMRASLSYEKAGAN